MAHEFSLPRGIARLGAAVLLAIAGLALAMPAQGASLHGQMGLHSGNSGGGDKIPFNVDPDPCGYDGGHHRGRGQSNNLACDDVPSQSSHGHNGDQRPGPSAFGLQFNSYGN